MRLDSPSRRTAGDRRGRAGVLPRPDRELQDSAIHQVYDRVPNDGHREDAEIQDAGDLD